MCEKDLDLLHVVLDDPGEVARAAFLEETQRQFFQVGDDAQTQVRETAVCSLMCFLGRGAETDGF